MSLVRPEYLKRIVTLEMANAYIDQAVKELKEELKDDKVLLAL